MTPNKLNSIILFINIIAVYGANTVLGHSVSIVKRDSNSEALSSTSANAAPLLPTNNNNSIQYLLYTPENPTEVCYFEPDASNKCSFNPSYKFKILIHGYTVQLLPGNFFEQIKDTLLEYNKYNIIIVNWTKYNGKPYLTAVAKAYPVGVNIGKMISFLVKKGVNPSDVHIIGHSLGAHVAGVAGKQVSNLGRVTGLDPAGPLFSKLVKYNRLTDTSAELVDVIHTSNYKTGAGLGLGEAIGSIDFYPNGGNQQPACQMGKQYRNADAEVITITTQQQMASCYHNIVLPYFMNSIHLCNYLSVECGSYEMYSEGRCGDNSNPTNRMGLFCVQIPGLPTQSKFYLDTSANPPYCEKE